METAEELYASIRQCLSIESSPDDHLVLLDKPRLLALIEAYRAAAKTEGKREFVVEMKKAAAEWRAAQAPCEWKSALNELEAKYAEQPEGQVGT